VRVNSNSVNMSHMIPVNPAEKKKADAAENTYIMRPSSRFPAQLVKETLRSVLVEKLSHTAIKDAKYTTEGTKAIADAIRSRLKALGLPRYKYIVQVVIGENKGQGFRMATKCLWDGSTDDYASEDYKNDNIFAVAVAYGVYLY